MNRVIPEPLDINRMGDECPACHGSGIQYNRNSGLFVICPVCLGTGKRPNSQKQPKPSLYNPMVILNMIEGDKISSLLHHFISP